MIFKYFLHYNKDGIFIGWDKASEFATKEAFEKGRENWITTEVTKEKLEEVLNAKID